jgi:flavorubredoxin
MPALALQPNVTELAPDTYRISVFHPGFNIQFNQFLLVDDQPFLMHAGLKHIFPAVFEGVSSVMDPANLRWIGVSHFESDECGALNEWIRVAPDVKALSSFVGAHVMLDDFADGAVRPMTDNEMLDTGRHSLRFLSTPHLPHGWDAGLFFDDTERTLFCSDLFFHPGDPEPVVESGIVERAREAIIHNLAGPMAKDMPYTPYTDATLARLAALEATSLAIMHGSSFRGDAPQAIRQLAPIIKELLDQ